MPAPRLLPVADPAGGAASADADATAATEAPTARFLALLRASLADGSFDRLLLGRYRGTRPQLHDLAGIDVRRIALRGAEQLCFVYHHATRDVTRNLPLEAGVAAVGDALRDGFAHAHLLTREHDTQWSLSRKGRPTLRRGKLPRAAPQVAVAADTGTQPGATSGASTGHAATESPPADAAPEARLVAHDRAKRRYIDPGRPFLAELGVTDARAHVIPAMARKWKQINKFVEIFDHALATSPLAQAARDATPLRVLDFGCGKGYLTFAVHEHLSRALGREAQVTGVELRGDLVGQCSAVARRLHLAGLSFEQGDVRHYAPGAMHVMIALHACDTATDDAIALGIRAGAAIIMCSPCCHKELRPQMRSPAPLRPLLQHGIHMAQEAEMVTDGLRALLLESEGYATQVFEFVSPEHTSKNKMILAVRRERPAPRDALLRQVADLKAFYGVREQRLEQLLAAAAAQRSTEPMQAPG